MEPKVPSSEEIEKQAEIQIKRGKSTGRVALDIKAIKKKNSAKKEISKNYHKFHKFNSIYCKKQ